MKKLILSLAVVICFSTVAKAEELMKLESNSTVDVYLVKHSLTQENSTVRSIWVKYNYTKKGANELRSDIKSKHLPKFSKVKYEFDCSNNQHRVAFATIYEKDGTPLKVIRNASAEDVVPGSVADSIRSIVCSYEMEHDAASSIEPVQIIEAEDSEEPVRIEDPED